MFLANWAEHHRLKYSRKSWLVVLMFLLVRPLSGCSNDGGTVPASVGGYNYTDYYIDRFRIANEGRDNWAGGPNLLPRREGGERYGGGGQCCISIPLRWQSDMKVVIKWNVDKVQDGKTYGQWYTATTRIPPYDRKTAGFYVHFLPGDRIRVEVGGMSGPMGRVESEDEYIVQGVLDEALNAWWEMEREKERERVRRSSP